MAKKNEMLIAGGVVAAGLAYYLFFGKDASAQVTAPPPKLPGPPPGPFVPPAPSAYTSVRCPGLNSEVGTDGVGLPDEYKKAVDEALASNLSAAEYGDLAQTYNSMGWKSAAACFVAAQVKAAAAEGNFTPVPGGNSVDQTKTCAYWVGQYNTYKAQVDVIKAGLADPNWINNHPNWQSDLNNAAAGLNMARSAAAQLGGCGLPLT